MKVPRFVSDITALRPPPMPEPYRQLCRLEPRLERLWGDAAAYARHWEDRPLSRLEGKAAAWRSVRAELMLLVGPDRIDRDDILCSRSAYDCAYRALLDAMGT
jgi:hypothetical protein